MGISIDSVWAQAQRLTPGDRMTLSRRLFESVGETETERKERVAKEMSNFFGGWSHDDRSTEEIVQQIRAGRNYHRRLRPSYWHHCPGK